MEMSKFGGLHDFLHRTTPELIHFLKNMGIHSLSIYMMNLSSK